MSKVITFSTKFPPYHPRKGEPTNFIEKLNKSLGFEYGIPFGDLTEKHFADQGVEYSHVFYSTCTPKHHTVRAGNRWKVGDKFSPRVWSGIPYRSKQIIIAPDIEIKKVWDFKMIPSLWADECSFKIGKESLTKYWLTKISTNDGLTISDFVYWFAGQNMASSGRKPFEGQIICWNENVNY